MKYEGKKNQRLILALAVGFFIGIIFENMIARKYGTSISIFREEQVKLLQEMKIAHMEYLFYILKFRLTPLLWMGLLWNFKWRKMIVTAGIGWVGVLLGRTVAASIITLGGIGIVVSFAMIFPHICFYALAYTIVLLFLISERRMRWNHTKTVGVVLLFVFGLFLEVYVNPIFLKFVIKWI